MESAKIDLGGVQNSWAEDYLPKGLRDVGSATSSAFSSAKKSVSDFFVAHPTFKKALTGVAITGVLVGGSLLLTFGPQLIHTHFIQSIVHSGLADFGKNAFLWGKGIYEQGMSIIPTLGGAAALIGATILLSTGKLSSFSSTDWTIVSLGGTIGLFGATNFLIP